MLFILDLICLRNLPYSSDLSNIYAALKQHNNVTRFTAITVLNSVAPKTATKSKLFILLVLGRGQSLLSSFYGDSFCGLAFADVFVHQSWGKIPINSYDKAGRNLSWS
jgi:hypothetical protein